MTELDKLLQGQSLSSKVPILRVTEHGQAHFSFAVAEDGSITLNFDVVWGPGGAERLSFPMSAEGWRNFLTKAQAAGSSIEIPTLAPQ